MRSSMLSPRFCERTSRPTACTYVLRFAALNKLSEFEEDALHEFEECERICRQPLNYGLHFEAALKLLDFWKKEALTYRHEKGKRSL